MTKIKFSLIISTLFLLFPLACTNKDDKPTVVPLVYNVNPDGTPVQSAGDDSWGSISPSEIQIVDKGSSLTFLATPKTDNITVGGWYVNQEKQSGSENKTTFELTDIQSRTTIGVTFIGTYTIDGQVASGQDKGGTLQLEGVPGPRNLNTPFVFTAIKNTGYQVAGWTLGGEALPACGKNAQCSVDHLSTNGSNKLEVSFEYTINTNVTGGAGSVSANPSNTVKAGQSITFTANPPQVGYIVQKWMFNGNELPECASEQNTCILNDSSSGITLQESNTLTVEFFAQNTVQISMTQNLNYDLACTSSGHTVGCVNNIQFTATGMYAGFDISQWTKDIEFKIEDIIAPEQELLLDKDQPWFTEDYQILTNCLSLKQFTTGNGITQTCNNFKPIARNLIVRLKLRNISDNSDIQSQSFTVNIATPNTAADHPTPCGLEDISPFDQLTIRQRVFDCSVRVKHFAGRGNLNNNAKGEFTPFTPGNPTSERAHNKYENWFLVFCPDFRNPETNNSGILQNHCTWLSPRILGKEGAKDTRVLWSGEVSDGSNSDSGKYFYNQLNNACFYGISLFDTSLYKWKVPTYEQLRTITGGYSEPDPAIPAITPPSQAPTMINCDAETDGNLHCSKDGFMARAAIPGFNRKPDTSYDYDKDRDLWSYTPTDSTRDGWALDGYYGAVLPICLGDGIVRCVSVVDSENYIPVEPQQIATIIPSWFTPLHSYIRKLKAFFLGYQDEAAYAAGRGSLRLRNELKIPIRITTNYIDGAFNHIFCEGNPNYNTANGESIYLDSLDNPTPVYRGWDIWCKYWTSDEDFAVYNVITNIQDDPNPTVFTQFYTQEDDREPYGSRRGYNCVLPDGTGSDQTLYFKLPPLR